MSEWQPGLYLEFGKERTRPAIDLVTRINVENPGRIIDIGCGPGNSTSVLKARWAEAEIIGLDNSETMINEAKLKYPDIEWHCADAAGDLSGLGNFDIIFSSAAIHWIPQQEKLLPKLFRMLNKNGVLAVQVPYVNHMPIYTELMKLISSEKWKGRFVKAEPFHAVHTADFYYRTLSGLTAVIDLWKTEYYHIMNTHAEIVRWYSSTGLKQYLDCLKDNPEYAAEFLRDYEDALKDKYVIQGDLKILFPFSRLFFVAVNT